MQDLRSMKKNCFNNIFMKKKKYLHCGISLREPKTNRFRILPRFFLFVSQTSFILPSCNDDGKFKVFFFLSSLFAFQVLFLCREKEREREDFIKLLLLSFVFNTAAAAAECQKNKTRRFCHDHLLKCLFLLLYRFEYKMKNKKKKRMSG